MYTYTKSRCESFKPCTYLVCAAIAVAHEVETKEGVVCFVWLFVGVRGNCGGRLGRVGWGGG